MDSIIELSVGTDFSASVLDSIIEMNNTSDDVMVSEVYGSLKSCYIDLPSSRPDFRLSNSDKKDFENFVKVAIDNGISVDYTVNAIYSSSLREYMDKLDIIVNLLKYLEDTGIQRVIVANPLLMEIISEMTTLKIKVSTIQAVNRASAIKYYARFNVDRICADIYVNRNIPLLRLLCAEAANYGIEIELLVNEGCFFGDTPCSNIMRSACYAHSSMGGNPTALFSNWPFERCQKARTDYPICWLKIPYILPQYLKYYQEITGINHFKVTGRTNTHEYLLKTVMCYMNKEFNGKIPELFMLPQNIPSGNLDIYAEQLISLGFFDKLYNENTCDYRCETCNFCDAYGRILNL